MPNSHAQTAELTCPDCGQTFTAEIWLVLDAGERPDLMERARAGALHDLPCPHCGHEGQVDAPLLVYRPDEVPTLLYLPERGSTAEQDSEQGGHLLALLRERLGDDWREAWVARDLSGIAPIMPPADPGGETTTAQADVDVRSEPTGPMQVLAEAGELGQHLLELLNAGSLDNGKQVVERHPDLLTDEADALIAYLLAVEDRPQARQLLQSWQQVLSRCRALGVDEAFEEAEAAAQMPPELREVLQALAAEGVEINSSEDLEQALAERPELQAKLEAAAGTSGGGLDIPPDLEPLIRELTQLTRLGDMPRRIDLCQQILSKVGRVGNPIFWAAMQNELANSLAQTPLGDRAANIEQAIHHYSQALEVYTREAFPVDWAMTQNNLANAFRNRIRGDRAANIEQAIHHYSQALEVRTREAFPGKQRQTQKNLGSLLFTSDRSDRWSRAIDAYQDTLAASELLYQVAATPEARRGELREVRGVPDRLAYAIASANTSPKTLAEAVTVLEQNRARWLSEILALRSDKPPGIPESSWQLFTQQRQRVQELQAEVRVPDGTPGRRDFLTLSALLRQARTSLQDAIEGVQAHASDFMPVSSFTDIQSAAANAPLVYLLTTPVGGLALIVRATSIEPVWLPFTEADLDDLLVKREGDEVTGGYLPGQFGVEGALEASLEEILPLLGEKTMGPLLEKLLPSPVGGGGHQVVLIPTGRLALLPLHAAILPDGSAFLDHFTVRYAPSARALRVAQTQADQWSGRKRLAGVGNPLENPRPLAFAKAEMEEIAAMFGEEADPLYEHAATKQALLDHLPDATYAHFACHGLFDPANPLDSHLQLANLEPLTLREVMQSDAFSGLRLAALSACQTAIADFNNVPDEAVGLPAGLLQAGVPGVVGSLWPVNDLSTALLMVKFYEYHLHGTEDGPLPPAQALRRAQLWLRDVTGGELHDYFAQHVALHRARLAAQKKRFPADVAVYGKAIFEPGDDTRPYAAPYHWASFLFVGV